MAGIDPAESADLHAGRRRLALLIDADNVPATLIPGFLAAAEDYGHLTVRRVYGDWGSTRMAQWRKAARENGMHPIHQVPNTVGKNATDIALVIDAVDLAHRHEELGFCIVSSDADFTALAVYLREKGRFVLGIGSKKTPGALVQAYEAFIHMEDLKKTGAAGTGGARGRPGRAPLPQLPVERQLPRGPSRGSPRGDGRSAQRPPPAGRPPDRGSARAPPAATAGNALAVLRDACDRAMHEDGWTELGDLGRMAQRIAPGFSAKKFGYRTLLPMVNSFKGEFEVRAEGRNKIYIRRRE